MAIMVVHIAYRKVQPTLSVYGSYDQYHYYWYIGVSVSTSKRGRVHTFPFITENPCGPQRTKQLHRKHVSDAIDSGSNVSKIVQY